MTITRDLTSVSEAIADPAIHTLRRGAIEAVDNPKR